MNEYHLIASNDHSTKREKNIDINKLKAALHWIDFDDLTQESNILESLRNQPGLCISKDGKSNNILVSSRHVYAVDTEVKDSLIRLDIEPAASNLFGHIIEHDGYRLAFRQKGDAVILDGYRRISEIDFKYCGLFRAVNTHGSQAANVRGKNVPLVIGNKLYLLFGVNNISLGRIDLDRLLQDVKRNDIGPTGNYIYTIIQNVQSFSLTHNHRHIYTIDEPGKHARKMTLDGKKMSKSKTEIEYLNSWCMTTKSDCLLVCSLPVHTTMTSTLIKLSLFSTGLTMLKTIDVHTLNLFYINRSVLLDTGKHRPDMLFVLDSRLQAFVYSILGSRITPLLHAFDLGVSGDRLIFKSMTMTEHDDCKYMPMHMTSLAGHGACHRVTQTPNPKPQTPNPKPQTPNPRVIISFRNLGGINSMSQSDYILNSKIYR